MNWLKGEIRRSHQDRFVSGVVGGISEYLDTSSTLARIIVLFAILATGILPGLILYFLLVLLFPLKEKSHDGFLKEPKKSYSLEQKLLFLGIGLIVVGAVGLSIVFPPFIFVILLFAGWVVLAIGLK